MPPGFRQRKPWVGGRPGRHGLFAVLFRPSRTSAPAFLPAISLTEGFAHVLTRRTILLASATLAVVPAQAQDASARSFVEAIYRAYKGKNAKGISLADDSAIRRYFEPSLAALIIKDRKTAARKKEVGALDGDPFVDAQDWDIASFDIEVTDVPPDKAAATVKFTNAGTPMTVMLDLVRIKTDWKISDITWKEGEGTTKLRALFTS